MNEDELDHQWRKLISPDFNDVQQSKHLEEVRRLLYSPREWGEQPPLVTSHAEATQVAAQARRILQLQEELQKTRAESAEVNKRLMEESIAKNLLIEAIANEVEAVEKLETIRDALASFISDDYRCAHSCSECSHRHVLAKVLVEMIDGPTETEEQDAELAHYTNTNVINQSGYFIYGPPRPLHRKP